MDNEESGWISGWILEFLLRQPSIDDKILNNLINVLPVPNNNNLRFKKTLILRQLETHVEKGTIFKQTIELVEQLEKMGEGGDGVKGIWQKVTEKYKGVDVFEVVRMYVNDEKEKMGPSFLELACKMILRDDGLRRVMGLDEDVQNVGREVDVADKRKGNEASHIDIEKLLGSLKKISRRPHLPFRPRRGTYVDPVGTSHDNYDSIPTPEVNKVHEALETSSKELHAVVKDPLLDALSLAESFVASNSGENISHDDEAPSSSHDWKGNALEANGDDGLCGNQSKRRKPNLMERNDTAHTVEWNGSIHTSEERSPKTPHWPSPKSRTVSPLNIYKLGKLTKQRERKKWTPLEEDTLRAGVELHGKGNWKLILNSNRDIFEDRTEVDLKDKWRNLMR